MKCHELNLNYIFIFYDSNIKDTFLKNYVIELLYECHKI